MCGLSSEKAAAVARAGELVVAADTTVEVDGLILGKPTDAADARRMLSLLSARTHRVHTGVTVHGGTAANTIAVSTAAIEQALKTLYPAPALLAELNAR